MSDRPDWLLPPPMSEAKPLGERLERASARFASLVMGVLGTAMLLLMLSTGYWILQYLEVQALGLLAIALLGSTILVRRKL